jgi:mitogen-activated protein kinase kinase kinase 9
LREDLVLQICFIPSVPADGVKGKTWGPSTVHQKERAHIRPVVERAEGHRQWSRSAPNLEKTQKGLLAAAAAAAAAAAQSGHPSSLSTSSTLPDLGELVFYDAFQDV